MNEVKLEYSGIDKVHVWGGHKIVASYMATYKNNTYQVEACIRGLDSGFIELEFDRVVASMTNNEDTLVDEAILDVLNDYVRGDL